MTSATWTRVSLALLSALGTAPARALPRPPQPAPAPAFLIDVEEKLGARVPAGLVFANERGERVRLGDHLSRGRPVLLTLAYYRCPMLCDLVLKGLGESLARIDWLPGRDYQAITVSIDPKDGRAAARAKQAQVLRAVGHASAAAGWPFLTGGAEVIARLADSVGFRYTYDPRSDQFAHPAVAMVLAPDGRITRYLYGVAFRPLDVRLALTEARAGRGGGGLADRVLLSCFRYDPSTRRYGLLLAVVLKGGSALVLVTLATTIALLWRRDRARRRGDSAWTG